MLLLTALLHALLFGILAANLLYLRRRPAASPFPSTEKLPSLSVLVPARNEETNLRRLLPLLLAQDYPDYEVVVYDDASTDGTWAVLERFDAPHLQRLRGDGPPAGWVGKVHALYQATRGARGERYLFLDADTCLEDERALRRLVAAFAALPAGSVLTGLPRLRGGAMLLVSLVPFVILSQLPWPLVRRLRHDALGAVNGQCWMIDAGVYRRLEPHVHVAAEILEDVEIGRYLKRSGLTPALVDVQREVSVFMYRGFGTAWRGFRKNAYLIAGGSPLAFAFAFAFYAVVFVLAPFTSLWLLASLYALKAATDLRSGMPAYVTLLTPVSFWLGALLLLDSAFHHLAGRVAWKDRRVGGR